MAGTLPLAMAQQVDINGQPLAGALVYFYVAGTVSTPQTVYADFGLTAPLPNPLTCDQTGRVPMFWLADGQIHVRLIDSNGTQIIDITMQVLGPSSGGGGGGTVDPTTVLSTGDIKAKYGTGPISGFVRLNGLTIGNATSGATERANADTQALFIWLYGEDPNLATSAPRTGNALNDYNSGITIAVPDGRGRAWAGLDDMGNAAAGRLTVAAFGNGTVLGTGGGSQTSALNTANIPAHTHNGQATGTTGNDAPDHTHSGETGVDAPDHAHTINGGANFTVGSTSVGSGPSSPGAAGPATVISGVSSGASARHAHPFTSGGASTRHQHAFASNVFTTDNGTGSGTGFPTTSPFIVTTFYIKL